MAVLPIKSGRKRLPMSAVLTFGKYKGETIAEVAKHNPLYIKWCVLNLSWFELDDAGRREVGRLCGIERQNKAARQEAWAWGVLPSQRGQSWGDLTDDDMRN